MSTFLRRGQQPRPPQGRGHYSEDGRRWFDERSGAWLPVRGASETLVIALEDLPAKGFRAGLMATLAAPRGSTYSWFVGHVTGTDPRWPSYRLTSHSFPRVAGLAFETLAEEAWPAAMTEALRSLRSRLEGEGWHLTGRGEQPWSYTYERPAVDWPQ